MGSKVTISVDKGASHTLRASRTARPTGNEYEAKDIKAGSEETFDVGDEELVTITVGGVTEQDEESGDTEGKKK